jgi:hypothetical protein
VCVCVKVIFFLFTQQMKLIHKSEILLLRPYILSLNLLWTEFDKSISWRSALTDIYIYIYIYTILIFGCTGHYLPPLQVPNPFQPSYENCPYRSAPVVTNDISNL